MAAPTYTTGYPAKSIYRTPLSTEGQEMIWSSGSKARFLGGSQGIIELGSTWQISGKMELKSSGEFELEAGSTLNVEAGASINIAARGAIHDVVVTYTCSTATLNLYDRYVVVQSSNSFKWNLPKPTTAGVGLHKTIRFRSAKGTTHNIIIGVSTKGCNFGTTHIHSLNAAGTNANLIDTPGKGIWVHLLAQTTAKWAILTPITTDRNVGKILVTSATHPA